MKIKKEDLSTGLIVLCKREPLGLMDYKEVTGRISSIGETLLSVAGPDGDVVFLYSDIQKIYTKEEHPEMYL